MFRTNLRGTCIKIASVLLLALAVMLTVTAQAQTLTTLYSFAGEEDGGTPNGGLVLDRAGNLSGTVPWGGIRNCYYGAPGCGLVFKLSHEGWGWIFNPLYQFEGGSDGWGPGAPLSVGPDGIVYGTTAGGGNNGCTSGNGCGTVFKLQPPPTACRAVYCPWTKTGLYDFTGGLDGAYPYGSLTFDQHGNVYGTTNSSQNYDYDGSVYELSPSNGSWLATVLYTFTYSYQVGGPFGGVVFDKQGNLWGTSDAGGNQNCLISNDSPCGVLFELTPSASGWNYSAVYQFDRSIGGFPTGTLVLDENGNLYGTLAANGPNGNGGVYEYSPFAGLLTVLYSFTGEGQYAYGPHGGVVMDGSGKLYGVDPKSGVDGLGFVFRLTPSNGSWVLTDLHDFTGQDDGATPSGPLTLDATGNLYGTTQAGGAFNAGAVFKIAP
jgi:uncharacterized repeat protein (TIGR03803 family)